jgi:hypothetical protein
MTREEQPDIKMFAPNLSESFLDRFWSKVEIKGPNDCWEWKGIISRGYGKISLKKSEREGLSKRNRQFKASRLSYFIANGPYPEHRFILHKCDNKLCVNPNHLELGNNKKNIQDAYDRGLKPRGEDVSFSKLTNEEAKTIKYDSRHPVELAKIYGIDRRSISKIQRGKRWGWIE